MLLVVICAVPVLTTPCPDTENTISIVASPIRKKRNTVRTRYVLNGFVYHLNAISGTPPLRYLGCAELKKSGCRGRATLPVRGTIKDIRITQPHNHPPDLRAEERFNFTRELGRAVQTMPNATLKQVYESVAELFPVAALEIPFRSINSSLHRWRHQAVQPIETIMDELKPDEMQDISSCSKIIN